MYHTINIPSYNVPYHNIPYHNVRDLIFIASVFESGCRCWGVGCSAREIGLSPSQPLFAPTELTGHGPCSQARARLAADSLGLFPKAPGSQKLSVFVKKAAKVGQTWHPDQAVGIRTSHVVKIHNTNTGALLQSTVQLSEPWLEIWSTSFRCD